MLFREGKVLGIVRWDVSGRTLSRSFNFGILGQQEEHFAVNEPGEWVDFFGGMQAKHHLRTNTELSKDGREWTIKVRGGRGWGASEG